MYSNIFEGVRKSLGIDLKKPWVDLPEAHQNLLLQGGSDKRFIVWEWKQRGGKVWKHGGKWEGIVPQLIAQFKKTAAGPRRMQLEKYMQDGTLTHVRRSAAQSPSTGRASRRAHAR